ncbi:septum formation family protein [Corynebacterium caspium]|uniref:septum formation family protein n=1 Tax=Corynebacterium caspium TaxID=234828 RepID=UPI000371D36F|nr:septum formation family protein [Corynebacterium caspium]WKD59998.1 putative membrane protein [Corynebacterium caspium DSM 44850]
MNVESSSPQPHTLRGKFAVRALIIGCAIAAVFGTAYTWPYAETGPRAGTTTATKPAVEPFTTATVGDCLNWDFSETGLVTNFQQSSCDTDHRFEITAREDLASYPSSEFGPAASPPSITRQAQLREELCAAATLQYLNGRLDPLGKFSIAPILPPPSVWDAGDRTMLCGVQANDESGRPLVTVGPAAKQDQARVVGRGSCLTINKAHSLHPVDCAADHHLEVTTTVNLLPIFDHTPSVEEQDAHLREVCTTAAMEYLGSEENLYNSTLQPYWRTLGAESWEGGSHSVNCALIAARDGDYATLQGSATGPFTIDGNPPPPQPVRRPLR